MQILWKFHRELLSYCPWFDIKMLVLITPTVSVRFTLYLAKVFIRSWRCARCKFCKILSKVNELLPLIRLKKSCFNLFLLTRYFFHFNKNKTIPIFVNNFYYTPVEDGTYYGITHGERAGGGRPLLCPEHISKTILAMVLKFHGWIDLIKGECSAQES